MTPPHVECEVHPDDGNLTPVELRIVNAIAGRLKEHPPVCLLGLDAATVESLKEIATGYREGKTKAVRWMAKLIGYGLLIGLVTALANLDVRAMLRGFFGLVP